MMVAIGVLVGPHEHRGEADGGQHDAEREEHGREDDHEAEGEVRSVDGRLRPAYRQHAGGGRLIAGGDVAS